MKQNIIRFFGMLGVFLFIVTFSIAVTINFVPLYSFDVEYLNIAERLSMSKDTLMENYRILLSYLNFPWVRELKMPDFSSSQSGLFHFYEVKRLFLLNYIVMLVTAVSSFFFLRYMKKSRQVWELIRPFQWGIIVPVFVLLSIAIAFDQLFVLFHQIFFNNDAWLFNPSTDPIILALPETFFMHCFILAFVLIELQIFIGYIVAKKRAYK